MLDTDAPDKAGEGSTTGIRGFIYQALGQMAQRIPSVFKGDPNIAEKLFLLLPGEPAGVRAQVQEAISNMASAYRESDTSNQNKIVALLTESFESEEVEI